MALIAVNGGLTDHDESNERMGAGTIGESHMILGGSKGNSLNAIIDDQDPRITYGAVRAEGGPTITSFTAVRQTTFDFNGSYTQITSAGSGFTCIFNGTSIGILGRMGLNSSQLHVYIDGVLAPGRTLANTALGLKYAASVAPLNTTDTTIQVIAPFTSGSGSNITAGSFVIDNEIISYTGYDSVNTNFTGCTRGAFGTTPATHAWSSMLYAYSSTVPLNFGPTLSPSFSTEQIVYYNPFLSPGDHRITVAVVGDPNTGPVGNIYFGFDGLLVGSMIGSRSILRSIGSVIINSLVTDGAGRADVGALSTRTGVSVIGFLGYNVVSGPTNPLIYCLPDGGGTQPNTLQSTGQDSPAYRLIGQASSTYSVQLIFSYLGESL